MSHFFRSMGWVMAVLLVTGCGARKPEWYAISGNTMGTTYHIQYFANGNYQHHVDRLLEEINNAVSTYIPTSTISRFNDQGFLAIPLAENGAPRDPLHGHFLSNLEVAYDIFKRSSGYFDPTVGPLVEAWGFGKEGHQSTLPDSSQVDSLKALVGMQYISLDAGKDTIMVRATKPGMRLDFSALAKGYAVDRVFELIHARGASDLFVEIGGEVRSGGHSPRGDDWIVGINTPDPDAAADSVSVRLRLRNMSMATSGNYRNYYTINGRRVWHTINPKTGYPEENNLLSASITDRKCIMADALATASMAMGTDDAIGLIWSVSGAGGYFIYRDLKGNIAAFTTDNLKKDILTQ